ncbi:MAG: YdeI/OmpD-associated family protein [Candidatus Doudnabacteria bacterium]
MTKSQTISQGVVHRVPADLKKTLLSSTKVLLAWEDITPLARNEWICWVMSPKTAPTRAHHIKRLKEDLLSGKRRPCCWPGCSHRKK